MLWSSRVGRQQLQAGSLGDLAIRWREEINLVDINAVRSYRIEIFFIHPLHQRGRSVARPGYSKQQRSRTREEPIERMADSSDPRFNTALARGIAVLRAFELDEQFLGNVDQVRRLPERQLLQVPRRLCRARAEVRQFARHPQVDGRPLPRDAHRGRADLGQDAGQLRQHRRPALPEACVEGARRCLGSGKGRAVKAALPPASRI